MSLRGLKWSLMGQSLILLPEKAIFWEEEKTLIVSDLHIGKVGHFRKAGIAIPKLMEQEELATLSDLIHEFKPVQLIFLGDLFHSDINSDWNWLQLWRDQFPHIKMLLIQGNHDILNEDYYKSANFDVYQHLKLNPFLFIHDKNDFKNIQGSDFYILSGHVHPAIKLKGKARQTLLLSCFYFRKTDGILPAFGKFTGKYCIKTEENDTVFGIMSKKIVHLPLF
ncbi:MAG: ligase-associated DNA damage response endonuclease PdeM [Sphingobacteriaceae bacterium]|nr:ligase-associated DNA damage response endonuclease PdeM [Sphingobacteriaceae bacterium]